MRELKPSLVVSTGSAIAVSFLPVARVMGIPAAYIESAARADGPSLTGRIIRWTPGVQLFSQYRTWARPPWHYVGSVFDGFTATELPATRPVGRIVVTLGTIGYGFRRLVERILQIVPEDCEVVWQVGETDVGDLPIAARSFMSTQELEHEMQVADVVVAHAGIGSALAALAAGRCPILVPRDSAWGEHVDDHQRQIAATLAHLGLALNRSVEALSQADLVLAAGRHVEAGIGAPRLDIVGRRQSVAAAR
jgi:UDP-N-acetylglucosamine transferase subunit ALG13